MSLLTTDAEWWKPIHLVRGMRRRWNQGLSGSAGGASTQGWRCTNKQGVTLVPRLRLEGSKNRNCALGNGSNSPDKFTMECPHPASDGIGTRRIFLSEQYTNLFQWSPVNWAWRSLPQMRRQYCLSQKDKLCETRLGLGVGVFLR